MAATGAPPTGQLPTSASPFAIAAARPEHPAYPQPPQLFPGSTPRIASSLSSTSTANFFPASPRNTPMNKPVPPTITAAIITAVIFIVYPSYISPENPQNAIAIRHAVSKTIGVPWKDSEISLYSIFSRIPAIITIAIKNPTDVPTPFTTPSKIV